MNDSDPDFERVKKASLDLSEHFDSVQIFVTRHDPGDDAGTVNITAGHGNWCARIGQITRWVHIEKARDSFQVENGDI